MARKAEPIYGYRRFDCPISECSFWTSELSLLPRHLTGEHGYTLSKAKAHHPKGSEQTTTRKNVLLLLLNIIRGGVMRAGEKGWVNNDIQRSVGRQSAVTWRRKLTRAGHALMIKSGLRFWKNISSHVFIVGRHVVPVSLGGLTVPQNIVPACYSCNSRKGTKTGIGYLAFKP